MNQSKIIISSCKQNMITILDRLLVPGLSEYPSGYEVHAEITDLLNKDAPTDPILLHCYIPLKYSFKWIKILKQVPSGDLRPFAEAWYNVSSTTTATERPRYRKPHFSGSGRVEGVIEASNTTPPPPHRGRKPPQTRSPLDGREKDNLIDAPGRGVTLSGGLLVPSIFILSLYFMK